MAGIPPQFLAHVKGKGKGKEKEGKAEPGDSPAEDSAEGDKPNPFAKGNPFAKKGSNPKDSKKNSKDSKSKAAFLKNVAQKGKF